MVKYIDDKKLDLAKYYNCRAIASNIITIDNPLISSTVLKLQIKTIKNPTNVAFVNLIYKFKLFDGTIISADSIAETQPYIPGNIKSCNITFFPSYVHEKGLATVTIELGNELPQNADLLLTFYQNWPYEADSTVHPLDKIPYTCDQRIGGSVVKYLGCMASDFYQLWVIQAFYQANNSDGSVRSFTINSVLSPPTLYGLSQVSVSTGHKVLMLTTFEGKSLFQMSKLVDEGYCYVKNLFPRQFTQLILSYEDGWLKVGQDNKMGLSFQAPFNILSEDSLQLLLPQQLIDLSETANIISLNCSTSFQSFNCTFIQINKTYYVLNFLQSIPKQSWINITTCIPFKPHTSSGIKSLGISLTRSGHKYVQESKKITVYPSLPFSIGHNIINKESSNFYTIDIWINLQYQFYQNSVLKIKFPSAFIIINESCSYVFNASKHEPAIFRQNKCSIISPQLIMIRMEELNSSSKFLPEEEISLKVSFQTTDHLISPQTRSNIFTSGRFTTNLLSNQPYLRIWDFIRSSHFIAIKHNHI